MKFISCWARNALFVVALSAISHANAASVSGQGTWETTLQGRDLDGNPATVEAYYDTVLDITWLADANYAGSTMTWAAANVWAASLDVNGYTGWRLPTVMGTGLSGCVYAYTGTDCGYHVRTTSGSTVYSEMATLFYDTLGNLGYYDTAGNAPQPGWGLTNTGPFSNIQSDYRYWSATEYAPYTPNAWNFFFYDGYQDNIDKSYGFYAWAVQSGNVGVAVVPVPAAVWLFGSGLVGLIGCTRRLIRTV
jgi:hypothetical protein